MLVSSFSVYGVAELPRGIVLDETTPVETQPRRRDLYAQCKLRQEQLAWSYHRERQLPLTVLRPGVIYGPRGGALSSRVGLRMPGVFLFMGNDNLLPLSYVENCAEAIVHVGQSASGAGEIFNVLDDELMTCRAFYDRYRREVEPLRTLPLPYPLLKAASALVARYHDYSRGQLPAVLTPYKVAAMWKGTRFSNAKLKGTGWTPDGVDRGRGAPDLRLSGSEPADRVRGSHDTSRGRQGERRVAGAGHALLQSRLDRRPAVEDAPHAAPLAGQPHPLGELDRLPGPVRRRAAISGGSSRS